MIVNVREESYSLHDRILYSFDRVNDGGTWRVQHFTLVDDGFGTSNDHRLFIFAWVPRSQTDDAGERLVVLINVVAAIPLSTGR